MSATKTMLLGLCAVGLAWSACSHTGDVERERAEAMYERARELQQAGEGEAARAQAEATYERAVELADDELASRAAYLAFHTFYSAGEHRGALDWAARARDAARRGGSRRQEVQALLGAVGVLRMVGATDLARDALERAAASCAGDCGALEAWIDAGTGNVYFDAGDWAFAREAFARAALHPQGPRFAGELNRIETYLREARDGSSADAAASLRAAERLLPGLREHVGAADASPQQVRNRRATLRVLEAELLLEQGRIDAARDLVGPSEDRAVPEELAWRLDTLRGDIAHRAGQPAQALQAYERACAILAGLSADLDDLELVSWFRDRKRRPFEAAFGVRAELGQWEAAFALAERVKSSAFVDALLRGDDGESPSVPSALAGAWADASARYDRLRTSARRFLRSPLNDRGRHGRELLAGVGDKTVLSYFRTDDQYWLLLVEGGELTGGVSLGHTRDIEALVARYRQQPDDASALEALGTALLPFTAERLATLAPRDGVLYASLDGALHGVPFAALRVDGVHLVERNIVVHVPSVASLALIRDVSPDRYGEPVIVADPHSDLPGARRHALSLAGQQGLEAAVGGQATADVLRRASDARLLDLGAHTQFQATPALQFADRAVATGAILRWGLAPRVAVVSSCASARSEQRSLWGSIVGAFLASGARSVVGALWSVDDRAAERLMTDFYRHGGGVSPARGLAFAQRDAIGRGVGVSEWSGFVVAGLP